MSRALAASGATADRLGALVDDLLDVSRLTAGRLALRVERVDIGELLREVVARLRDQAAEVGSTIELTVAAPVVGAWDRGRLEQLVTNLLSNAIKYGHGEADRGVGGGRRGTVCACGSATRGWGFRAPIRAGSSGRSSGCRRPSGSAASASASTSGGQIALAHGGTLAVESDAAARRHVHARPAARTPTA